MSQTTSWTAPMAPAEDDGWAIFDDGPGAWQRAMNRMVQDVVGPPRFMVRAPGAKAAMRELKGMIAMVDAFDHPINVPTAQELVMRQELGEFDE